MKTNVAAALMAGMLFLVPLTHAAKTPAEQLANALVALDVLIKETDLPSFSPFLAPVLKAEVAPLNKMLIEDKVKFSDLVIAQLVADRLEKPVPDILQNRSEMDWAKTLEGAKVQLEEAVAYLEEIHTNVAFAMVDRPKKKHKKKLPTSCCSHAEGAVCPPRLFGFPKPAKQPGLPRFHSDWRNGGVEAAPLSSFLSPPARTKPLPRGEGPPLRWAAQSLFSATFRVNRIPQIALLTALSLQGGCGIKELALV